MESIVKELIQEGIIENKVLEFKPLKGGTSSQIGYLKLGDGQELIVKLNAPKVIEAESYFLNAYQDISLFPRLIYTDPAFRYIVYTYIEGESNGVFKRKEALKLLVQKVINYYKPAELQGIWGLMEEPVTSWAEYLLDEIEVAGDRLKSILSKEDYQLIKSLIMNSNRNVLDSPYLLHGDCGVHNFLLKDGQFSGVIDPTPIIGLPIYDLVFAFCSSPIDLSMETISQAAKELRFSIAEDKLVEEVMIGLYIRISRCVIHHPEDLPMYLSAWDEWKDKLDGGGY
ncbi:MAG: aminoglycoside phosphotransferase family protein [Heyndrickxia sp.]